jgi:hypothetical protein
MKTLKLSFIIAISLSLMALNANAQIKVLSNTLVGLGTTTPNSYFNLHIASGSTGAQSRLFLDGGQDGPNYGLCIYSAGSGSGFNGGYIMANSSHLIKLCIYNQSTGGYYVGIGTNSPSCELDVHGVIKMNGSTVTSDVRLKENINNVTSALGNLTKLQGVTYRLKKNSKNALAVSTVSSNPDSIKIASNDFDIYNRDHIGFLAQDVQKIYPQLVYTDKDGMLSVDYVSLIPVLVESIKEISSKRDADNADFQSQLAALKDKMQSDRSDYEAKLKQLSDKLDQLTGAKGK